MESDGDICFGIDDDATWTPDDFACSTNQNYDDNQWHYFSAVRNTTALELYIDGVKQAEDTSLQATASLSGSSPVLRVGIDSDGSSNGWAGMLDELTIYGYARGPTSIKTDYNLGLSAHFGPKTTCAEDPGSCITKGLVGYWSFEEGSGQTTADLSGNSNNGTLGADANPGSDDPRWSTAEGLPRQNLGGGGALDFDGVDDYVDCNAPDLSGTDFTLSAWIKVGDLTADERCIISGDSASNYYVLRVKKDGALHFWNMNADTQAKETATGVITTDQWYYVIFVFTDSDNGGKFYVDGVLKPNSQQDDAIGELTGFDEIIIGQRINGPYDPFDGLISDVRIYNRALSPEEIRYLYNRGGPVGHWQFDEGSAGTAYDETSNNYDAILHNITTSTDWVSGKFGGALDFNGTDAWADVGTCYNGVKTVSFWTKPDTTTEYFVDLNGAAYISSSAGVVSATGFTSPTIYIDGKKSGGSPTPAILQANQWHHITITTDTGLNASDLDIGRIEGVGYMQGLIDDVKIYQYARTPAQVKQDHNASKAVRFR